MSELSSALLLGTQAAAPEVPGRVASTLGWFFVYGEPTVTIPGVLGSLLTWIKVVGLFALVGWVGAWAVTAIRERVVPNWLNVTALVAVLGAVASVFWGVLETTGWLPQWQIGGVLAEAILALICGVVILIWLEAALWSSLVRKGTRSDLAVLGAMHLALGAGVGVALLLDYYGARLGRGTWSDAWIYGARLGATYMGFVALARVGSLLSREVLALRWRRIYSIAWHSVIESVRRMWAPWVVIAVFGVILAFTHWFLQPPDAQRVAELGRLYVGTLLLLCSLLLTVMITILTPISLPTDIQQQTIFTVVSKPVRRLELIWGRMLGFMSLVTVLLLVFGLISLGYLWRNVHGRIVQTEQQALIAEQENRPTEARLLRDQADQLRTRMSARVPVKGSLIFFDSRGTPQVKGIDVGQELEYRSHIEGATPARAIWTFGNQVPHPVDQVRGVVARNAGLPTPAPTRPPVHRPIPVQTFLRAGTIEYLADQLAELRVREAADRARQTDPNLAPAEASRIAANLPRIAEQIQRLDAEIATMQARADELEAQFDEAEDAGDLETLQLVQRQLNQLHSPPIEVEMTFTVYRTTKGVVGEPVYAALEASNPRTGETYRHVFPIREYYTNRELLPASLLAGSRGDLQIEIQCISPTQYLGMAESDLYLKAREGDFGTNFFKGLFGIWLQAMVLTAIGVFAGTFLSWPVALLTTIAFFVAGQIAFAFLQEFAFQSLIGGGPFESLIRLLTHDNQMSELSPTLAVVTAKSLDSIVMPVMSRLVFVVPNFSALDFSNTVADGFAVGWDVISRNLLLGLAYAIPFSVAGYFILKNREVAA